MKHSNIEIIGVFKLRNVEENPKYVDSGQLIYNSIDEKIYVGTKDGWEKIISESSTVKSSNVEYDNKNTGLSKNLQNAIDEIYQLSQSLSVPAGTIVMFSGINIPNGWLLCNGSEINRIEHPNLYEAIGISYGKGDGETTFNLPDFRGRFVRGVDNGAGNDPDAASRIASNTGGNTGDNVGSLQGDAIQKHNHQDLGHFHGIPKSGFGNEGANTIPAPSESGTNSEISHANIGDPTDSGSGAGIPNLSIETRPVNININFIIKE